MKCVDVYISTVKCLLKVILQSDIKLTPAEMSSLPSTTENKELLEPDIEEIKEEINGDEDKHINKVKLIGEEKLIDEEEPIDEEKPIDEEEPIDEEKPINEDNKSSESEDDRPIWERGKPKRRKKPKPTYEIEMPVFRELPKRVTNKINYVEINSDEGEDEDCFFANKPKRQRKHSSDGDGSWNEEEDSDDSAKVVTKGHVEKEEEKKEESESDSDTKPVSEYEKLLEKNRAEKMAFLQSLKMNEAKDEFRQVMDSIKRRGRPLKKTEKVEKPPPIMRKSSRLDKKTFDYSEGALFDKAVQNAQADKLQAIPPVMSVKEALESEELYESFLKDINIQESKVEPKPLYYSASVLKKLKLGASTYSRFHAEYNVRISALAWYPSSESLILAGGCTCGNLSLQNVGTKSSQYLLKAHSKKITNLEFNPYNPVQVVSCSYDGTLRCGDIVKEVFSEVYNISRKTCLNDFDFFTESAYVVAQGNGNIAIIDIRTSGKRYEKQHACHDFSVYNVQVHPVNKDIFLTTNKGIRIWDLRKLSRYPLADATIKDKGKQQAYFSPVTGNYILGTSYETIRLYDSTDLTQGIKVMKQKKINRKGCKSTGTAYRACWLPNSEEEFFIGTNVAPRGIQVCDAYMNVLNLITHEHLASMETANVFHPYIPALAAGKHIHRGIYIFT